MKLVVLGGNAIDFFRQEGVKEILRSPQFSTGEFETFSANSFTQSELMPVQALGQRKLFDVTIEKSDEPFSTKFMVQEDIEVVSLAGIVSARDTEILELWPAGSLDPLLDSGIELNVFGMTLSGDFFVIISWEMMKRVKTELMSLEVEILQ